MAQEAHPDWKEEADEPRDTPDGGGDQGDAQA